MGNGPVGQPLSENMHLKDTWVNKISQQELFIFSKCFPDRQIQDGGYYSVGCECQCLGVLISLKFNDLHLKLKIQFQILRKYVHFCYFPDISQESLINFVV